MDIIATFEKIFSLGDIDININIISYNIFLRSLFFNKFD